MTTITTIETRLAALAAHAAEERENATILLPVTAQPAPAPTPEKPARKSQPKRTLKTLEERPVTNDVGYKTDHMNRAFDIVCYSWKGSVRPMQKGFSIRDAENVPVAEIWERAKCIRFQTKDTEWEPIPNAVPMPSKKGWSSVYVDACDIPEFLTNVLKLKK